MKNSFLALPTSKLAFLLIFIFLFGSGCGGCGDLLQEIKMTREQMVFALDDATTKIQNSPSDWQTTLYELEEQFSRNAETNIAERVSILQNQAVGMMTTGVICVMDAVANRVVLGLLRLKAELLGDELPLPEPHLCSTSKFTVDLNTVSTVRREIVFFGDGFEQRDKISACLVKIGSSETYMDNSIHVLTDYQFVLDLAPYGDNVLKQFDYISIRFKGEEISNIAIQQDNLPPPTQTKNISPAIFGYIPPHRQGDAYIGSTGAAISLSTSIGQNRKQVYLKIYMSAYERGGDCSAAYGLSDKHIFYTAPDGWHIKRVEGPSWFSILNNWYSLDGNEKNLPLELGQWTLYGYNDGSNLGADTRVSVNFNSGFTIIIEKDN